MGRFIANGASYSLAEESLKLLPASDLHYRLTLLEDAARACRAELRRRPSHCQEAPQPQPASSLCMLLQLGHDEVGVVAHELCDPLWPLLAVNLGSTAKGLRVPMQAALAQLRQQHQEVEAFAALTGRKYIAQLRIASSLELGSGHRRPLTLAHWRALGTLIRCCSLPRLKVIHICCSIYDECGDEGVHMLAAGLHQGVLPSLQMLALQSSQIGDEAAAALASALTKRALPSIQMLQLSDNQIGDVGLVALAPALRQLPMLRELFMSSNLIGDRGLAALVAQPMTGVLESLEELDLSDNHVTDASCVTLASVLLSEGCAFGCEALPSFREADLREDSGDDFSQAHLELFEAREGLAPEPA